MSASEEMPFPISNVPGAWPWMSQCVSILVEDQNREFMYLPKGTTVAAVDLLVEVTKWLFPEGKQSQIANIPEFIDALKPQDFKMLRSFDRALVFNALELAVALELELLVQYFDAYFHINPINGFS
uniref:BAF250_C domain-containing protein n=1 Tax=Panagrellus redivivus TaxID=6233 RepID=A0A7E4V7D8_PANRE